MGRNKHKLPNVFDTEQLVQLFDAMQRPKVAVACFVGFFCGLRISEVCKLKQANIDLTKKMLKVEDSKNKNREKQGYGKDRYVPIPDQVIPVIKKWMGLMEGGKWVFPSDKSPDTHLRKKSLDEQFRHTLKMAGLLVPDYDVEYDAVVNGKVQHRKVTRYKYRFHTLRHSYATYLRNKGVGIDVIKELLGHELYDTTLIYAKIAQTSKTKAVSEAFNVQLRQQVIPQEEVRRIAYPEPNQSPLSFLQMQMLRGEITEDEFQRKAALLQGMNQPVPITQQYR
jgi:integrase/recombinase XerD